MQHSNTQRPTLDHCPKHINRTDFVEIFRSYSVQKGQIGGVQTPLETSLTVSRRYGLTSVEQDHADLKGNLVLNFLLILKTHVDSTIVYVRFYS